MNTETKACPMCGETIPADARECKCCLEDFAINDESSKSGFKNIYSKVRINVSRLVNTSKITNETTNIYRFIKINEGVTFEEIKESFQKNLPDLEVFLSRLIKADFISKNDSGGKVVYSVEHIDEKHKSETGPSREIPDVKPDQDELKEISTEGIDIKEPVKSTIQDVDAKPDQDELQKTSAEEIDIEEPAESPTQDVDTKPDQTSVHEFYSSISKTSNVDDVKLTQTSTTNVDGEINDFKPKRNDTKLIIEIYTFVKSKESTAYRNITTAYNMYNIDVKGVLNTLINAGLIFKYNIGGRIIFSKNPDLKASKLRRSRADTSKEDQDTDIIQETDFKATDYETNIRKVIFAYVEKHANVAVSEIAHFFDKEPVQVKGILSKLVETGDVCKHDPADTSDNATYSTKQL